jgi:multidrug transporter EmrE-like cation transporter
VILAILNTVTNMVFAAAYPVWSAIAIAVDVLVIYALVVHGRETRAIR